MGFRPFGDRFDIVSAMSPAQVKAAVRSRKAGWLDPKTGARGWTAGPFVCLWLSAHPREQGPMLVGRISPHGAGARITGRAGSNLHGLVVFSLATPGALLAAVAVAVAWGGEVPGAPVAIGLMLLSQLMFLWPQKTGKAEPLVRFLRRAVKAEAPAPRPDWSAVKIARPLALNVSGVDRGAAVTPETIHEALLDAAPGDFVILEAAPETYIQTARDERGFVLERRDGDHRRHFRAIRRDGKRRAFTTEEVTAVLMAYASDAPPPAFLRWEPFDLAA